MSATTPAGRLNFVAHVESGATYCIPCHRRLTNRFRDDADSIAAVLPTPDFCRYCACPLSERAKTLTDRVNRPPVTDYALACLEQSHRQPRAMRTD